MGHRARACCAALGLTIAALGAESARAFEALDGRLQLHGFYEAQVRTIANNFDPSDDYDLTQWYNVLDLELELAILQDPVGPLDMVSAFVRVEARYDCVWRRACGMARSVNTFGDRSEHLPLRLAGARRNGLTGTVETGDTREIAGIQLDRLGFADKDFPVGDTRKPAYLWHFPGVDTLFGVETVDPNGDPAFPAFYTFERFVEPGREVRFGLRSIPAPRGRDLQALGPWLPRNKIEPIGALADRANPFNPNDIHPIFQTPGSTAHPYRPAPNLTAGAREGAEARGLFIPNEAVRRLLERGELGAFDQNFRQAELEWNRGASQQDEKELKEAYLDLELFDARLWLRLGKQSIVWGKTELFRTTDQLNPQDLALSTLPSLEESRISLWSARGVYSFWDVGPLSDVRFELALNFDQFEPTDLGACGEPYTPNPVCDKSAGLFAHGLVGQGLAGEVRPPDPWDDIKGLEIGARVEFRWDRFSFALMDFWGYDDFPYVDQIFPYERNVDFKTGRPRRPGADGRCLTGNEPDCLQGGQDALLHHHANQQRFAVICSSSVGFSDIDPSSCALSVLNSPALAPGTIFPVSQILSHTTRGNSSDSVVASSKFFFSQLAGAGAPFVPSAGTFSGQGLPGDGDLNGDSVIDTDDIPLVALVDDGALDGGPLIDVGSDFFFLANDPDIGLSAVLSNAQEALLGCGKYWDTNCDREGIDLLNTEASAFAQSWPGQQGTAGRWDTTSTRLGPQPGTVRFRGGGICTRWTGRESVVLPGCRGPGDPGYRQRPDGTPPDLNPSPMAKDILRHPFTGEAFRSEIAAFSWNTLMVLTAFSGLGKPADERGIDDFDPARPFRRGACSFRKPQFCSVVQSFYAILHTTRAGVRAGGNDRFGRADFDWHQGGSGVLRYRKRNVLGVSMDFAEDVTKSNWSFEATWIADESMADYDAFDGRRDVDTYNLTVSVDRPTFINFLNPNRTFFINSQWFFQYVAGYRDSFPSNGPVNVLATFSVSTGYYQDRLLPSLTLIYDFNSVSGGGISELRYLINANFSIAVGVASFFGRWQAGRPPLRQLGDNPIHTGKYAEKSFSENGLAPIRDRDEIFLNLRYTF